MKHLLKKIAFLSAFVLLSAHSVSARKIATPAAGPSYTSLMKTAKTVTNETAAVAKVAEVVADVTPLPHAHPATKTAISPPAGTIKTIATTQAPSGNDVTMKELKKRIATHLVDNTLGSYHRARIMQFNSRVTLLEARSDEYSETEMNAELNLLTRNLDGVFEEAQLERAKDVTTFANSTDVVTASNLVSKNGIPTSGNNTNVFLIINRSEEHGFAPILYRIMFKQPVFHFNTPYTANKDILWQHGELGKVSRAMVATPQQILDDPYFADKPLPSEMVNTLRNPGIRTHYDLVHKKMADGSYRQYRMGNLYGWIVPVPVGKITSGTAPTAEALGLEEKLATLPPHGDPHSTREFKLLVEYQFAPIAEEGAEPPAPEVGTALIDPEEPFVMPVAGATITKAFFGYGPDLEHFISNGRGLDTNGNMMWYTSSAQAHQLFTQYHKKMIAQAEAAQVAKQQAVLEELAFKSAQEEEDGERREKDENNRWFALYKKDKTTGEDKLIGWFSPHSAQAAPAGVEKSQIDRLFIFSAGNTSENNVRYEAYIVPNGYNTPSAPAGFKLESVIYGFGPDFQAYMTPKNDETGFEAGYPHLIYGPHYKDGYKKRDQWIAAGYQKAPHNESGGKPKKGGFATLGSGIKNIFSGIGKMFTGDFKTD